MKNDEHNIKMKVGGQYKNGFGWVGTCVAINPYEESEYPFIVAFPDEGGAVETFKINGYSGLSSLYNIVEEVAG